MKEEKIIQYLIEKYSLIPLEDDEGAFFKNDNTIRLYWIDDEKGFNTYNFFGLDEVWLFTNVKADSLWFEISLIDELELSSQCLLFTTEGI